MSATSQNIEDGFCGATLEKEGTTSHVDCRDLRANDNHDERKARERDAQTEPAVLREAADQVTDDATT